MRARYSSFAVEHQIDWAPVSLDRNFWSNTSPLKWNIVLSRALSIHQNFRKFGNSVKWYRNFPEKFPEILETVEFPKWWNHSTEKIQEQSWMEKKLPGKNIPRTVYLARFSFFSEILENAVPFATGSCWKLKPDVLVEWKAPVVLFSRKFVFLSLQSNLSGFRGRFSVNGTHLCKW